MRFQPILNTIFSKFSGGACPRTPLEGLKTFLLAAAWLKNFFRIDLPPKQKILDRTLFHNNVNKNKRYLPLFTLFSFGLVPCCLYFLWFLSIATMVGTLLTGQSLGHSLCTACTVCTLAISSRPKHVHLYSFEPYQLQLITEYALRRAQMLNWYKETEITYFMDFKYIHKQGNYSMLCWSTWNLHQICFIAILELH